jgi:diguanylate cyclase (GGDEF)-like protein
MSGKISEKSKIIPGLLALIAIAATVVASVMVLPKVTWGPAIICALVAGLLMEGASFSVSAIGYYSLATALYFLVLLSGSVPGEGTEKMLLSLGLGVSVAGICSIGRFLAPGSDHYAYSMSTRLAGYGLTVIRVALVGGVVLGAERAGLGILVGAGAGYGLWLALDSSLVGGVLNLSEENETVVLWERTPFGAKAVMALAPLVGIAGSGLVKGEVQQSVLAVVGVALVGLAFRNTAQYYIDEIVVGDQRQMEVSLNQARAQKRMLDDQLSTVKDEKDQAIGELRSVYTMADGLGASTKVEDTLSVVAYMIKTLRIPYRSCVIFLQKNDNLEAVYKDTDSSVEQVLNMSHLLQLEEALIKQVFNSRKAQLKPDMGSSSEGRIFKDERSALCVPLLVSKESIGVIYVGSLNVKTHNEEHKKHVKMIAALAAPSIKTAMLFEDNEMRLHKEKNIRQYVEAKNAQLAELQVMGQKMGATLETSTTIEVVAEALKKMTPAQSVILFTHDKSKNSDGHALKAEFADTPYDGYVNNLALRDDEGLLGQAIRTKQKQLVRNTDHAEHRSLLGAEQSVVIAPLLSSVTDTELEGENEQELLGVLYVGAAEQNALTEDHGNLIETVSYQTAMALKNARLYEQTQQQALTDGLTGLFTHRLFQEKLGQEMEKAEQTNQQLVLCMVDCDNFKTFNDTLGHPAGDALLKDIASLLKDKVRSQDIVSRYGGDEFALLLKTSKENGVRMCERIREAFQLRFGGQQVQVTASIGVACYPTDALDKKDLAKAADDALYVAKRGGRNFVAPSKTLKERTTKPIVQEVLVRV